jgi:hypothetical protein
MVAVHAKYLYTCQYFCDHVRDAMPSPHPSSVVILPDLEFKSMRQVTKFLRLGAVKQGTWNAAICWRGFSSQRSSSFVRKRSFKFLFQSPRYCSPNLRRRRRRLQLHLQVCHRLRWWVKFKRNLLDAFKWTTILMQSPKTIDVSPNHHHHSGHSTWYQNLF